MDTEFQTFTRESDLIKCYLLTAALIVVLIGSYFLSKYNLSNDRLATLSYLMMDFHNHPDYDNFMEVYKEHKKLLRQCGSKIKYWIYGVYLVHPQFFNTRREETLKKWIPEIERGLRQVKSVPTSILLDCIFALYFATGDKDLLNIVKNIANNSNDLPVKVAAQWAYSDVTGLNWKNSETTEINE